MKMEFSGDEIVAIVQEHIIQKWSVPVESVAKVQWKVERTPGGSWVVSVIADVKTTGGSPYRQKGS